MRSFKSPPMSKREANWDQNFQLLKQFKEDFGACDFQGRPWQHAPLENTKASMHG
jgi:hypothetical protein